MNEKYEKILEIIKENSPCHIDDLYSKIWEAEIYQDIFSIKKALEFLHKTKRIKISNFRVEACEV